jgi:diguanylate cyclase (GGDEF)-like protein
MLRPAALPAPQTDPEFQSSLIAAILEASPDGILVVNADEVIVLRNRRLLDIFGVMPEQLADPFGAPLARVPDRRLLSLVLDLVTDREAFLRRVEELYADPRLEDRCEVSLKDGRTIERHSSALWDPGHDYLGRIWFFRDVSARKQAELTLQDLSQRDPLTGVANRRQFIETAAREFARARRFGRDLSFIVVDLDWFKRINDRWGHAAGDRVLKAFCECARTGLRQIDLFARIGGEEFAVLAPDTDLDGAVLVAERLRVRAAALAVVEGDDTIRCTISAGVATLETEDLSPDDVLKRADVALYEAKHAGRDRTARARGGAAID